jgi:hypothetical protein
VVRSRRGVTRQRHVTPREFERHLEILGLPGAPVRRLTRLFEAVRYGTAISDDEASATAIAALSAIVDACKGES